MFTVDKWKVFTLSKWIVFSVGKWKVQTVSHNSIQTGFIYGADVVEWFRALDIRLSDWCCSVSMV